METNTSDSLLSNPKNIDSDAQQLRKHFKFTEEDLAANRRGVLSEKQMKRFMAEERSGKRLGLILGALLFLGGVGLAFPVYGFTKWFIHFDISLWGRGGQLVFGLGVLLAWLLVLAMIVGGIFMVASQLIYTTPSKLAKVQGRARLERGYNQDSRLPYYDLHINEHQFDGDRSLNKIITEGEEYIVYYIPGPDEIMSMERI